MPRIGKRGWHGAEVHKDLPDSGVNVVNHDVQSPIRSTAIRVLYLPK